MDSRPDFKNTLANACIFFSIISAMVLLVVWALPGTIAARNIAIVIGLVASSIWFYLLRPKITPSDLVVPALLMAVPIWLWVIYFLFPIDAVDQYKEMKGTWFRVMLLIIFGFNLGLMIDKNNKLAIWIWLALASLPIAALMIYLNAVYVGGIWSIPQYTGFFKTKVAGVYFLMWPCLLAYACIHKSTVEIENEAVSLSQVFDYLVPILLVIICLWMLYALDALTGILVAGFCLTVLLLVCLIGLFKRQKSKNYMVLLLPLCTSVIAFLIVATHYDNSGNQKLNNLISDIVFSYNIDGSTFWQGVPNTEEVLPMGSHGNKVNGSTYERVSFFVKGFEFLSRHPLGSGDIHFSFGRYMNQDYPGSVTTKAHSGWLDFALGAGLPGLLFLWAALCLSINNFFQKKYHRSNSLIAFASIWMLGGVWILFWPAELSYREFIEHLFFLIVLLRIRSPS